MEFVDSHCHLHDAKYDFDQKMAVDDANKSGVKHIICVGTDALDSQNAVDFASKYDNVWATVGLHPHDAKKTDNQIELLNKLTKKPKVVAIGECGLDYFYLHSTKKEQELALRKQIELSIEHKLPLVFHVRDAYDDFWPIFDDYKGLTGVFHSFSADSEQLNKVLSRDLYIGLNGIVTFSKKHQQLQAFKEVPLNRLMLETDAPYLTPVPYRGTINIPKYVVAVAEFLSELRSESLQEIANQTTNNVKELFNIT